jgi:hypothetical protein
MSLSVNSSNTTNPFAYLQSMLQQGASQTGSASQSDPLSQLVAFLDQQGASSSSSASSSSGASSASSSAAATSATTPQFGPQMLQALLALQADVSNALSPSGASSQAVANTNGSSTTTISYADGSSVSMTSAPSSSSASGSSSSTAGSSAATNNLLEQLIQMQAQLLNTTTPQSIMTV